MPFATALFVVAATLSQPVASTPAGLKIDDYMTRLERLGFSGALLVAKDGDYATTYSDFDWQQRAGRQCQ